MTHTPFSAVFFDLDGTLIDTAPDFAAVINQMRLQEKQSLLPYKDIRAQVSNGSKGLITHAFKINESHPDFERKRQQLLQNYLNHICTHSCLFPSLDSLLTQLENSKIPWGIVTNKPLLFAKPLLDQLGLTTRCATLICPDHVNKGKPDPESLYLACKQINVDPKQCVYIGDHERDIMAGINAGMTTVAAAYGYIDEQTSVDQWRADRTANTPNELSRILLNTLG